MFPRMGIFLTLLQPCPLHIYKRSRIQVSYKKCKVRLLLMIQLARRTFVISTQLVSPGSRNNFFFFSNIVLMCRLCNFGHLSLALGGKLCPCFRQHPAFSSATWTLSEHKLLHGLDETRDLYLVSGIRKQFIRIKAVRLRDFLSCLGSH